MSVPEQRERGTGNRRLPPLVVRFGKWQATQPLTSTQHLVALTLSLYAGADGGGARPGVPRLAEATGFTERTVTAALGALVERGVIRVTQPGGGQGRATEYRLGNGDPGSGIPVGTLNSDAANGEPARTETLIVGHPKRTGEEEYEEEVRMREAMRATRAALLANGVLAPTRAGDRELRDEELERRRRAATG